MKKKRLIKKEDLWHNYLDKQLLCEVCGKWFNDRLNTCPKCKQKYEPTKKDSEIK